MPSPLDPTNPASTDRELDVRGILPFGLSGRLVAIGDDGLLRSFRFDEGRVTYSVRSFHPAGTVRELVAFEGSVLVRGDDSSVRQLNVETGADRSVDLAGHRRTVVAGPVRHASTGELHLVARESGGAQLHIVVPAGALTRRITVIGGAPERIQSLAVGADHVVFVTDDALGVAPRQGELRVGWTATGVAAAHPVLTYRVGNSVALVVLAPSLERWTLPPDTGVVEREVLHPTAPGVAHGAGAFAVLPDPARPGDERGGFLGLVRHTAPDLTELVLIDTADLLGPAIATVSIPRPTPHGLRCTWLPATPH